MFYLSVYKLIFYSLTTIFQKNHEADDYVCWHGKLWRRLEREIVVVGGGTSANNCRFRPTTTKFGFRPMLGCRNLHIVCVFGPTTNKLLINFVGTTTKISVLNEKCHVTSVVNQLRNVNEISVKFKL